MSTFAHAMDSPNLPDDPQEHNCALIAFGAYFEIYFEIYGNRSSCLLFDLLSIQQSTFNHFSIEPLYKH